MRCLARTPQERYADYRALAAALEPFRSTTQVAAGLSRRFFANVADSIVSSLALTPVNMLAGPELAASGTTSLAVLSVPAIVVIIGYYGILEGRFGAAAGKAMLGLRVVGQGGSPPGILRGLLRAAIFALPAHVLSRVLNYAFVERMATPSAGSASTTAILTAAGFAVSMSCLALLFSTARRRNGYAALHDLGSGTRVVVKRRAIESRHAAAAAAIDPDDLVDVVSRIGPYVVRDPARTAEPSAGPTIVDGYDDRLRRKVSIEFNSPDTPALPPLRRDLGRPARARWLAGRRTADECWDAFEAIPGQPLTHAIAHPQPWSRVRHWLSDLTHEIVQGLADGSLPVLEIDRVWVGADDRVRLLDWPAPHQGSGQPAGSGSPAATTGLVPAPDLATAGRFLYRVAVSALRGEPAASGETEGRLSPPLPLSARRLLHSLRDGRAGSAEALTSEVDASLRSPAIVTRSTRAIQLAFCAAIPIFLPVVSLAALALSQQASPDGSSGVRAQVHARSHEGHRQGGRCRPRDGRDDRRAAGDRDLRRRAAAQHRRESRDVVAQDSVIPPGRPRAGGTGAGGAPESLGRGASESGCRLGPPAAQRSTAVGEAGDARGSMATDRTGPWRSGGSAPRCSGCLAPWPRAAA